MADIFTKIKNSFFLAWRGQEQIATVLWQWGGISYIIAFALKKFIDYNHIKFLDSIISLLVIIYYILHIVIINKCKPKKPPLTPEEKALIKEHSKQERFKSFTRKLFLQEPITKWSSESFIIVIDLYIIAVFAGYVFSD